MVLGKGCQPVSRQPLPSILRLAFTSSNPLSLTIHPRVPFFPIRLLWKPACCSTIPKRLILIGFLMLPQETSLSEISAVVMNWPSPALVFVEGGIVRHLTAVGTQFGRQEVFQTVPLLTRKANDTCHWLFLELRERIVFICVCRRG